MERSKRWGSFFILLLITSMLVFKYLVVTLSAASFAWELHLAQKVHWNDISSDLQVKT